MSRYLLTYSDNWADEMDIDGHIVLTEKEYWEFEKALERCKGFWFMVGSNQDIEYEDGEADGVVDVQKITEKEYKVLEKLGLLSAGFAEKFMDQLKDNVGNEDEDEEDEDEEDY